MFKTDIQSSSNDTIFVVQNVIQLQMDSAIQYFHKIFLTNKIDAFSVNQ
jgi:hypothetical protein